VGSWAGPQAGRWEGGMERIAMGMAGLSGSRLAVGCMGLGGGWNDAPVGPAEVDRARALVGTALELGIDVFDHADIYALGKAEEAFGRVLKESPSLRDRMVLQSKCGIRLPGRDGVVTGHYDLGAAHILRSVDGSLARLHTDRLDLLLLHRPDPLMEPDEVARAFRNLKEAGKVRAFGVSNLDAARIDRLQASLDEPLAVNQLQLSLVHDAFVDSAVTFNDAGRDRAGWFSDGTLEDCGNRKLRVQAWSPLAGGRWSPAAAAALEACGRERGVPVEAILVAWLLRHPAGIQPVLGTTRPDRLRACVRGLDVDLDRETWTRLWVAARGGPLP
jgi:predicted oxidoreductase